MKKQRRGKLNKAPRFSAAGKRLIAAMDEVVAHVEGKIALPVRYIEIPEELDVRAIRSRLGLTQVEFSRRFAVSQRSLQEREQGRRPSGRRRASLPDRHPAQPPGRRRRPNN